MHRERSGGRLPTNPVSSERDPWPAAGATATAVRAGGRSRVSSHPGTVPRRPTTDHGRARTACVACAASSPDHHLSNSGRRAKRPSFPALHGAPPPPVWTQNAPPGTRRRWGVWYRSRIRGGSSYATAYALPTRLLHRSSSPAAGDNPPRASRSYRSSPRTSPRRRVLAASGSRRSRRDPFRRLESPPGTRSPRARRRAHSGSRGAGRSPAAARGRVGE